MGDAGGLVAIVLAWVVFAVGARGWHVWKRMKIDNPSPVDARWVRDWIKALLSGDPDTDTDPDTDPDGYRLETEGTYTRVVRTKGDPAAPVGPPAPAQASRMDRWVAASIGRGARTKDIVEQGARLFRVAPVTVKRAVGRVRRGAGP